MGALKRSVMTAQSLTQYECGHCGYRGPCYGAPTREQSSAAGGQTLALPVVVPQCPRCGNHDALTEIDRDVSRHLIAPDVAGQGEAAGHDPYNHVGEKINKHRGEG